MDDSIQLANEKISQLMGELSHQTFDTYLILTRKGSDGYFELLFDKVTQQPCAAVFRRSGNHCLLVHESEAGLFVGLRGIAGRAYSGDFFEAFREVMDQEPIEKLALDFSEDDASADGLSLGLFTYVFRYFRMPMEELEERITSAAEMMDTVRAQKSPPRAAQTGGVHPPGGGLHFHLQGSDPPGNDRTGDQRPVCAGNEKAGAGQQ